MQVYAVVNAVRHSLASAAGGGTGLTQLFEVLSFWQVFAALILLTQGQTHAKGSLPCYLLYDG